MISTNQDFEETQEKMHANWSEEERQAARENAKRVLRESGLASMLLDINKNQLKGRGRFEEYDTLLLLRWGNISTLRHIWIEVNGDDIRFRLRPHRKCQAPAPLCDGEYHTFTSAMWSDRVLLATELKKYYDKPVAEASSD
ncbi:MAG TPA: hypothetical protein VFB12_01965 [Ktedonobacteraceae bacterium]|nr:hypothetical protein [Ktedonobacteraceae bacterium]